MTATITQQERLLAYLKDYGSITKAEGHELLGIENVGGRIHDLRKEGYVIATKMQGGVNRYGEATRYAVYELQRTAVCG